MGNFFTKNKKSIILSVVLFVFLVVVLFAIKDRQIFGSNADDPGRLCGKITEKSICEKVSYQGFSCNWENNNCVSSTKVSRYNIKSLKTECRYGKELIIVDWTETNKKDGNGIAYTVDVSTSNLFTPKTWWHKYYYNPAENRAEIPNNFVLVTEGDAMPELKYNKEYFVRIFYPRDAVYSSTESIKTPDTCR